MKRLAILAVVALGACEPAPFAGSSDLLMYVGEGDAEIFYVVGRYNGKDHRDACEIGRASCRERV